MKLLLVLVFLGLLSSVGISTTLVDIPTFDGSYLECITLKGVAFQAHGGINMGNSKSKYGIDNSVGALVLKDPISSQNLRTFKTEFSFMSTKPGSGLALFLSPFSDAGVPGIIFGLPYKYMAIVFDTRLSSPKANSRLHGVKVLLDEDITPISETEGDTLNSEILYTVWIVFFEGKISIFLSDSKLRPIEPILECNSAAIGAFIEKFKNFYIGFSTSQENYKIYNWKFETSDLNNHYREVHIPALEDFSQVLFGVLGILLMIAIFLGVICIYARNRTINDLEEDAEPSYGSVDVPPTSFIELMKNEPPEQGEVLGLPLPMEDMWRKDVPPTSYIELMKNVPPEQGEVLGLPLPMEDMWKKKGDDFRH
ncbi:putative concanavalin A-like lectin/glucanase domain-containing protein [Medicago truncatula]|uniref:Legume lectin beta domain protein n=1 Tax=Medicago truncatula TaxID=3880 RepID=G7K8J1_MEDTR|nr:legume lectin beta domain protein [Medicago truncatula]RHN57776.1 putative concanavalin A-like lectin/glucanase domain-containing protein [Medicago truncatula]